MRPERRTALFPVAISQACAANSIGILANEIYEAIRFRLISGLSETFAPSRACCRLSCMGPNVALRSDRTTRPHSALGYRPPAPQAFYPTSTPLDQIATMQLSLDLAGTKNLSRQYDTYNSDAHATAFEIGGDEKTSHWRIISVDFRKYVLGNGTIIWHKHFLKLWVPSISFGLRFARHKATVRRYR